MNKLAGMLCALALLLSIAATAYLLNAPLYQGIEINCTESGCEEIQTVQTLVEVNGRWVVYQLTAVTLVAGLPLLVLVSRLLTLQRWVTWISALLLLAYSFAGALTIGLFFSPSALLLLNAGVVTLFIRKETGQKVELTNIFDSCLEHL